MTRRQKLDIMLPIVSAMACAVSAYTTQQGLATATSDLLVSVGVALAGGVFLFVFSLFLMWRFPYADRPRQVGYGVVAVIVMVLAFGFSTQWSVIAMGGKDALAIHMQRVLDQADDIALRPAAAGRDRGEPGAAARQPLAAVRGPGEPREPRRLLGPARARAASSPRCATCRRCSPTSAGP